MIILLQDYTQINGRSYYTIAGVNNTELTYLNLQNLIILD